MTTFIMVAFVLGLRDDLASPSYRVRQRAEALVSRTGLDTTPAVEALRNDRDPHVRDWAERELVRRHGLEVTLRARRIMAALDPDKWLAPAPLPDEPTTETLKGLTERLYLDPEAAVRWAELAREDRLLDEDMLFQFEQTFGGQPPLAPPEPPAYWATQAFGYWALRSAWELRALRRLGDLLPRVAIPRD